MGDRSFDTRRQFLQKLINLVAVTGASSTPLELFAATGTSMPKRPLGKTGFDVSLFSLGGQATVEIPGREAEAVEIINRALDLGVNYIDTSAYYGRARPGEDQLPLQGTSERYIGKVLKHRRNEVFVATKTHDRTYDGAMRHLEKSLKNLQVDVIDLWQVHNVRKRERDTLDEIFARDGVMRAMEKVKSEGIVRFLGITGHEDPVVMNMLLDRFPFDNALAAINAADRFHNSYVEKFLPGAVKKNIGIVGMKIPARDRIFHKGGIISMREALEYVFTLPVSTVIVGIDRMAELEENVRIAKSFRPLSADQLLAIEGKAKPHSEYLQFFKHGLFDWPKDW